MTAPIRKIDTLQVLRGFAALLIVIYHAVMDVEGLYGSDDIFWNHEPFIYGIDLFFVLSGFVMIYTASGQRGIAHARRFMLRRIIRIVPLYWVYTFLLTGVLFVLPSALSGLEFSAADFIKSLFFVPYYDHNELLYPFLKLGWTLNYEIYFYAVFALFLLLPQKLLMPALTAFFLSTVLFKEYLLPEGIIRVFYGRDIVLNFLIGSWIGFLFVKDVRLPSWFIYIGGVILIASLAWIFNADAMKAYSGYEFPKVLFATLIVSLLVLPKKAQHIKLPKVTVFVGDSSYSLYLMHSFTIGAIIYAIGAFGIQDSLSPLFTFIICVIGSIIGGGIGYLLIEKPLLSWSKQLLLPKREIKMSKEK